MKLLKIFMALFFSFGILMIAYPIVATYVNDTTGAYVVTDYNKLVDNLKKQQAEKQQLFVDNINEKFSNIDLHEATRKYIQEKNKKINLLEKEKARTTYKDGEMLGYISIPKIKVELPIYEGTNDNILYKGVGRLKTSSLINGKKGNHTVLTGHSGYSTATLFDDLDLLEKNDIFYIHYYDEIHKYKIYNVKIIKPDKGDLYFNTNKNYSYATLVTCTPKTVNTHRLLVRGIRVPNDSKNVIKGKLKPITENKITNNIMTAILGIAIIIIIVLTIEIRRYRGRNLK